MVPVVVAVVVATQVLQVSDGGDTLQVIRYCTFGEYGTPISLATAAAAPMIKVNNMGQGQGQGHSSSGTCQERGDLSEALQETWESSC